MELYCQRRRNVDTSAGSAEAQGLETPVASRRVKPVLSRSKSWRSALVVGACTRRAVSSTPPEDARHVLGSLLHRQQAIEHRGRERREQGSARACLSYFRS